MRKALYAASLALLTIGGAVVAGFVIAFMLGGQSPPKAALAALAMEPPSPRPVAAAASTLAAPRFEALGMAPEVSPLPDSPAPLRATAVAGTEASQAAAPSVRPFPTMSPGAADVLPTATARASFINETFDSVLSGWPERPLAGWGASYENGSYVVRIEGEQPVGIAYPLKAADFSIAVDVLVESGAGGLVFMYEKPASFLWVGVDEAGAVGVERIDGEALSTLLPWQPIVQTSGAAQPVRLEVQRRGDTLAVMANAQLVASLALPTGNWEGRYGFVVAPRGEPAAVAFDNLQGERIP